MTIETLWHKARPFLGPLGRGYAWLMRLREWAYFKGLLPCFALPVTVISVGNLTLGGEGKTPVTLALAQGFKERGKRVVVVSRGYGVQVSTPKIASRGNGPLGGPGALGDEVYLLAQRLEVPVVVGRDRVAAGTLAVREFHPELLLLDDGFQHLRLARDIDLVLFAADHADTLHEAVFPAGRLREPKEALARASAFLLTKTNLYPKGSAKLLAELLKLGRPIFEIPFIPEAPLPLEAWRTGKCSPKTPKGKGLAFCGLAKPRSFFKLLGELGLNVVKTVSFPDHHFYTEKDAQRLRKTLAESGADFFITTEKDAVKLLPLVDLLSPCYVLPVRAQIPEGLWEFLQPQGEKTS